MPINQPLIAELKQEAANTRKMLERVPLHNADWKPHDKSMPIGRLAVHVAELPTWITMTAQTDGMDFATRPYNPPKVENNEELVALFDKNVEGAISALEGMTDENMNDTWTLSRGDQKIFELPKAATIRTFAMNHLYHHRAQLSVYLRLNNVPVPGMYGPSSDDMAAMQ